MGGFILDELADYIDLVLEMGRSFIPGYDLYSRVLSVSIFNFISFVGH